MQMEIKRVNSKEGGDRRRVSPSPRVSESVSDFSCFSVHCAESFVIQWEDIRHPGRLGAEL